MDCYQKSESGATAVIYAICAFPLLAGIGLTIDLARSNGAVETIQHSVDSAVLAATRDIANATLSDEMVIQRAREFFLTDVANANSALNCDTPIIVLDRDKFEMTMDVHCVLPTTMSGLVGVSQFDLNERGVAKVNVTKLDLALMLDVSGSMAGDKIDALKLSAKDAIATLITAETGDRVRIGIAPYSTSVNVYPFRDDVFDHHYSSHWCASERDGVDATTDRDPAPGRWIESVATTCPADAVTPLTSDRTLLNARIDALSVSGGTAGHLGVAWSRYLISPNWASVWPASSKPHSYGDPRLVKAVILMTDGEFNTEYNAALGTSTEQAESMCDAMKADGVQIFSVAFQAPPEGQEILETCASSPANYFAAESTAELQEAYESIASTLSELRLVI